MLRQVASTLRRQGVGLPVGTEWEADPHRISATAGPLRSYILCATSGGTDSLALATLLARYGRRIISPDQLVLLHIHHGWPGGAGDAAQAHVEAFAKKHGLACVTERLDPKLWEEPGTSWEAVAHHARHAIFARYAAERDAWILTAHHADDLAETLLWRLATGAIHTHGEGIRERSGDCIRPFLGARRAELRAFLDEEGEAPFEDPTNQDPRFLRTRVRQELMPAFERVFAGAGGGVARMVQEALQKQRLGKSDLPPLYTGPDVPIL